MQLRPWIKRQNIVRFRELLERETDPEKRKILERLIEEEIAKQPQLDDPPDKRG
jgi:hypothetical protein